MSDNTILGIKPTSYLLSVTEAVLNIIQPIDEHCGVCDEQGIEEVVLTEALKPVDKSVIDAFYYKKERVAGNLLSTNGRSLEKHGMGGQTIAAWLKDKIAITAVSYVRSTDEILRYMKKSIPKGNIDPKSYKKYFGEEIEEGVTGPSRMEIEQFFNNANGTLRQRLSKTEKAFDIKKLIVNAKGTVVGYRIEDIEEHILYIDTFPAVNNVNGYIKIVDIERYE